MKSLGSQISCDLKADVAQIILPLWATISSFTKWGGENGSKILPRSKGKLQKNRYKLVKMQRINDKCVAECCVPEGSSAEASSQVQKSNMDVCASARVRGLRGQRQEAILIKGKMATNPSPLLHVQK